MKSIGAISSLFTLPSKEVWNIENGLNWAYNQTLRTDMPCGLCNALELADEYRMNYSSIMEASDKLIKDQLLKIGGTGLLISLGTLFNPVGIPVSMGISWMLQLRLINSLAYLGGYDLNSENVRPLAFVLFLGKRAADFFLEKIMELSAELKRRFQEHYEKAYSAVHFPNSNKEGLRSFRSLAELSGHPWMC